MTPTAQKQRVGRKPTREHDPIRRIVAGALEVLRGAIANSEIEALITHISGGGVCPQFQLGCGDATCWYCPECANVECHDLAVILDHMMTSHPRGKPNAQPQ